MYGIDLGTTNSFIGRNGKVLGKVVKSIVDLSSKQTLDRITTDSTSSFKVDMSMGDEGKQSIIASTIVLKKLLTYREDDDNRCVISVPAFFTENQRSATRKAAELAGIEVVALINEPTAAAIAYSKDMKDLTVVYDLGGGTFDVSVIDSRTNIYDIVSTSGIILGGDDLDRAIMRKLIAKSGMKIHRLKREWRNYLKDLSEKVKLELQKLDVNKVDIDLSIYKEIVTNTRVIITKEEYTELVKEIFKPTIIELKRVIEESIFYGEKYKLILVGGSTRCPVLQKVIEEEVGVKPEPLTYSPDLIVAEGVSLFAQMVEDGTADIKVSDITQALSIGLQDGTVKTLITNNSKLPVSGRCIFTNPVETDTLVIDIYQGDSLLKENNSRLGSLVYKFHKVMAPKEADISINIQVNTSGLIRVKAKELLGNPQVLEIKR